MIITNQPTGLLWLSFSSDTWKSFIFTYQIFYLWMCVYFSFFIRRWTDFNEPNFSSNHIWSSWLIWMLSLSIYVTAMRYRQILFQAWGFSSTIQSTVAIAIKLHVLEWNVSYYTITWIGLCVFVLHCIIYCIV